MVLQSSSKWAEIHVRKIPLSPQLPYWENVGKTEWTWRWTVNISLRKRPSWKHVAELRCSHFNSVLLRVCPLLFFSPAQWASHCCPWPVTHHHSGDKEPVPWNSLTFKWEWVQVEATTKPSQVPIKVLSMYETGIRGWLKIKTAKFSNSSKLLLHLYLSQSKVVFNMWTTSTLGVISCEMWKITKRRKGHHQKAYICFSGIHALKKKKSVLVEQGWKWLLLRK